MVEIGLAYQNVSNRELHVHLSNQTSAASGQNSGSYMETFPTGDGEAGADGGNNSLISSSPEGSLMSPFFPIMWD